MSRVLLAWIGKADVNAAGRDATEDVGPIAQALAARTFDHVVLLNNMPKESATTFERWVKKRTKATIEVRNYALTSPTNHEEIYRAVTDAVAKSIETYGPKTTLTFHLSPGTPAMAAIWIIVSKTRFDAELIESSKERGVSEVHVPFELTADFIPAAVQQANKDLERVSEGLRPEEPKFGDILHRSEAMKRLVRRARQAAPFDAAVLIEGQSGTGKELLAAAIHQESPRKGKRMVPVNCGAIPKELVESQFFGHMKGAFTGATSDQAGFFEQADGGTLFLDEIGELPLDAQVKLLRALQQKTIRRVGGQRDIPVDVRIIAATNRNLLDEVQAGRFREDLYYRLAVLVLNLPPLRDREGDVLLLVGSVLERLNAENGKRPGWVEKKLSVGARSLLQRYAWPGNVRELEATLMRAVVFAKGATIEESEIRDALVARADRDGKVLDRPLGNGFSLEDVLAQVARHYLERALADAAGNKTKAAELVGLRSYQTLKNWLKTYAVR